MTRGVYLFVLTAALFGPMMACVATVRPYAWTIDYAPGEGGVIGYQSGRMADEYERRRLLDEEIRDAARTICEGKKYKVVRERLAEKDRNVSYLASVDSTSTTDTTYNRGLKGNVYRSSSTTTDYQVPMSRTVTDYWREKTIVCLAPEPKKAAEVQTTAPEPEPGALGKCSAAKLKEMRDFGLSERSIKSACE